MKPKFSTLIILTLICALLLIPFALSTWYIPIFREKAFELHLFLERGLYKQITGFASLTFIIFEIVLTARKRGKGWIVKVKLPGSMQIWRSLHIFLGVALLGTTLLHTMGSTGLNFNAIFLWVFFGVTLSALVGVVAETGILESPRRHFGLTPAKDGTSNKLVFSKGELIRNLRHIWLSTHIFLVSVFIVMLGFHIFLSYYYQ